MSRKKTTKKLQGVWTGSGKFLPFPLPIGMSAMDDVGKPAIREVLLHYGDPNEWSRRSTPLLVEVRAEFVLDPKLAKHLIERAKQLKVDITDLPGLAADLEEGGEEEGFAYKASRFARDMAFLSILRWLGWLKDKAPNGLRVPTRVPVASPKKRRCEVVDSDGRTSLEYALLSMREEALRYLPEGSTERAQFVAYCEYWEAQYGGEWS